MYIDINTLKYLFNLNLTQHNKSTPSNDRKRTKNTKTVKWKTFTSEWLTDWLYSVFALLCYFFPLLSAIAFVSLRECTWVFAFFFICYFYLYKGVLFLRRTQKQVINGNDGYKQTCINTSVTIKHSIKQYLCTKFTNPK